MEIRETKVPGLLIIEPSIFKDPRGYFFESYNRNRLDEAGIHHTFIQDNQSCSSYGIIRGLHYQLAPYAQTKLLRVLNGIILDVVIDLRKNSPSFGKSVATEMSAESQIQLLIPKGFAHGFSVLSKSATVLYKCDEVYHPEAERGIHYADPELDIDWRIPASEIIISEKDDRFPLMKEAEMNFEFKSPSYPGQP